MTFREVYQRKKFALIIAAVLFGLVLATGLISSRNAHRKPLSPAPAEFTRRPGPDAIPRSAKAEAVFLIHTAFQVMRAHPVTSRQRLEELRKSLENMDPKDASRAIRDFLDSKADAPSHLGFKIGAEGFLSASPSLRVFLLDYLGQIDPKAAAAYAKTILATMDSPDEWAIALRNCAETDVSPEGRSFVEQKLEEMWKHEPWIREPSVGFLEAFDGAVHLGGTNLIIPLTTLLAMTNNQAVSHAAYLTLDRLTILDAENILAVLDQNPDLMRGRELTRANYFARADVRETRQRDLLESYLLNPSRDANELMKFASLYPNANFMVSHNLMTRSLTPDHAWIAARDAEALRVVERWIQDSRFERVRPHLHMIQRRLEMFDGQAVRR